jgi:hypothetical protein
MFVRIMIGILTPGVLFGKSDGSQQVPTGVAKRWRK